MDLTIWQKTKFGKQGIVLHTETAEFVTKEEKAV